jgi:DNA-binding XRE family transcriptional regulator
MTRQQYKALRKSLALSQREMGERVGVAKNTIQRREAGELPIPREAELAIKCVAEHGRRKPPAESN